MAVDPRNRVIDPHLGVKKTVLRAMGRISKASIGQIFSETTKLMKKRVIPEIDMAIFTAKKCDSNSGMGFFATKIVILKWR